jgi:hypothetical protein
MAAGGRSTDVARRLQQVAAELHGVADQVRAAGNRAQRALGSTATGADRQMLAGLGRAASSAQGAQQALSAAATSLRKVPPKVR